MPFGFDMPNMSGYVQQGQRALVESGAAPKPAKKKQGWGGGFDGVQQPSAQAPKGEAFPRQAAPTGYRAEDGFDMSKAGAAEHAYADNAGQLQTAGATEQFATPGKFQGEFDSTAAGQYWNSLQGQNNAPRDMSAYYDRAYETGANRINAQSAARGQYNSSHALDSLGTFGADIGAQQAKDEADYDLKQRQLNDQIMSGAASAADASGVGRFNSQLGAARGSDESLRGRLGLLGEGAASADASRNNRVNSVFDNVAGTTGLVAGQVAGQYNDAFDADAGLFDANQEMGLGSGLQNLNGVQSIGNNRQAGTAATAAAVNSDAQMAATVGKAIYGMA